MGNRTMLLVVLLALAAGCPRTRALGAGKLPPRALARLGSYRCYHGPRIECAVLSPDGSRVASAARYESYRRLTDQERNAYDTLIVLWDAATGERVRELHAPHPPVSYLAFSPDGKRLAAACGSPQDKKSVVVFEVETGKLLRQLGRFKSVGYLQFSPDGKRLRVSEWLGPVSAWDAATGKQLRRWDPPPTVPPRKGKDGVCAVRGVLSPDGKVIVWEMGRTQNGGATSREAAGLRVHDADTGKLLYRKTIELYHRLASFAFSPDGKRFGADCDNLTVWETATGKELSALKVPEEVDQFAFAPDLQHAVIAQAKERGHRVRLWDLMTRKPLRDIYPGFVLLRPYFLETPQVFSADGKTLLLATDSTLRLFDTRTGKERAATGHRAPVTPSFSADGRTLFTSCAERTCSWKLSPGKGPALLAHQPRKAWEVEARAHSADGRLFLDRSALLYRVREAATGRVLRELEYHDQAALFALFSPDATRVLLRHCASERRPREKPERFRLYDVKTGKATGEIRPVGGVGEPVFSPNGRLLAWADRANAVHLHDAVSGKLVRTLRSSVPLPGEGGDNADLLFSPGGDHLIVTSYFTERLGQPGKDDQRLTLPTRVFHVRTGREVCRCYAGPEEVSRTTPLSCAACSPDARLLAVAEEGSGAVRLIELASGKVRAEFAGHRHGVHGLAFSPDGKVLASGGEDNVTFLWDVTGAGAGAAVRGAGESDLAAWWAGLASSDAGRAGDAAACLIRAPGRGVAFLKDRLRPAAPADARRLARLIAELGDDSFEVRQRATGELERLGELAGPALDKALAGRPAPEVRRRLERLLTKLEGPVRPPARETLRALRAIEVLEHLGTPEAQRCLRALAEGGPEARQTREARAALARLAGRR